LRNLQQKLLNLKFKFKRSLLPITLKAKSRKRIRNKKRRNPNLSRKKPNLQTKPPIQPTLKPTLIRTLKKERIKIRLHKKKVN